MKVYHGCKREYLEEIYCPLVYNLMSKGKTLEEAIEKAQDLYNDFLNPNDNFMLQRSLDDAQMTSLKSPFISTTPSRATARSFALSQDTKGYIYTIEAPDDLFYDFNKVREDHSLPAHKTYGWMNELGIPIQLKYPFEIIQIVEVSEVIEIATVLFEKK